MPEFVPDWDLIYLMNLNRYEYVVIKKPEEELVVSKEEEDKEDKEENYVICVREGCTVQSDGRWYYWKLQEPLPYAEWKVEGGWASAAENKAFTPSYIFKKRINGGKGTVGHPAPVFSPRSGNNWIGGDPRVIPHHVTSEMLDDLTIAHEMLDEHLKEGTEEK